MSNTNKIILVTIVATAILLGLGYAAITNITLNITGAVTASADSANFDVSFVGTPSVSDSTLVTAKITDETNATIGVSGLTSAGQTVTATYDIKNNSTDLSTDLKVVATNTNTEYFTVSSKLGNSSLVAGESTTVLVTVELTKTPIEENVSTDIDIELTAMPVQPGEEGTSEGTNDYDQAPDYRNEYGFYFNKAYSSVLADGTTETAILYEDGSMIGYRDNIPLAKSPANFLIYGPQTVDMSAYTGVEGTIFTASADGTVLSLQEMIYELNEDFPDVYANFTEEMNEYGFYYGQAYNYFVGGEIQSYVAYEDGSAELYIDNELYTSLPAGTLEYSDHTVIWGDDTYTLSEDGRILISEYGYGMVLDPSFWDRYNSTILITFEEAYTMTVDNGTQVAVVFYEDGSGKIFSTNGATANITEGTIKYSRTVVDASRAGYFWNVSENGTVLNDDGDIYTLDPDFWTRNNITKPE